MYTYILTILYFAAYNPEKVLAEGDYEVKRGVYPFMAFIYYPDETIVDAQGLRFLRSAVLIRTDWLVTSAVGPSVLNVAYANFPRKTLLARLGAISIDPKIILNEDEDEQEREVIEIVRPHNHSATQWWLTDISLMKTLMPFNVTSAVNVANLNLKRDITEKNCAILVYSRRYGNATEDKILMQLSVELLPSTMEACGRHFFGDTMICAADSNEHKDAIYDPDFCQGNSGGPLLCDHEIVGLQTYVESNCQAPHLYQLLSAWDNFITCGTDNACQEGRCENVCIVATKDEPVTELIATPTQKSKEDVLYVETEASIETETMQKLSEKSIEDEVTSTPTLTTIVSTTSAERTTESKSTTPSTTQCTPKYSVEKETRETTTVWARKMEQENEEIERRVTMEAQQEAHNVYSGAEPKLCVIPKIFPVLLVSAYLT